MTQNGKNINNSNEEIKPIKIALAIAVIVLILIVFAVYMFVQRKNIIRNAEQETNQTAEYIASNIANEIGYAKSSINLTAVTISQTMTTDVLENPAEVILPMVSSTPFGGIEYIRADGMNVMNIGEPFDASDRVYYIEGIKGHTGTWNNYHPKTSKETLINFYTPLMYQGKIAGVITGYIEASSQIVPIFEKSLYGQKIHSLLLDENDMVICSTVESEYVQDLTFDMLMDQMGYTKAHKEHLHEIVNQASNSAVSYKDLKGEGRTCVKLIPGTQWKVVIIVPTASFEGLISEDTKHAINAIVVIAVILIAYASYILFLNVKRRKEIAAEKEKLQEENQEIQHEKDEYYETLGTLEGIFYTMHVINLVEDTVVEYNSRSTIKEYVDHKNGAVDMMIKVMTATTKEEYKEQALAFTDLTTLAERMGNRKIISSQFIGVNVGWFLASFIAMERDSEGKVTKVIYTTRVIDEEKKQEEKLIIKTQTDELTGLFNRRAYEEDIYAHNNTPSEDDFVYISLDVNGLKVVNDSLGHIAGDELIIGACQCMKKSLGSYGRLYRTGGDEFVAIIFCNKAKLPEVIADFDDTIANWSGELVDSLTISYGVVTKDEMPNLSVRQLGAVAEQRMYDAKEAHYRKSGLDRRGQKDAHKALCDLYTKILKINLTDDTFQIVNMDVTEQTEEKGFSNSISEWLTSFGTKGYVHPDDLQSYLDATNIKYMREYFAGNKTSLHIFYRRRYGNEFKQVMMEIIPAGDFSEQNQSMFLYVKDIEK